MFDLVSIDAVAQIGLTVFGLTALIMVVKKNKWGFVVGLVSQPFWIATSLINQQGGVFIVSVAYSFIWIMGIYEWFYKKEKK